VREQGAASPRPATRNLEHVDTAHHASPFRQQQSVGGRAQNGRGPLRTRTRARAANETCASCFLRSRALHRRCTKVVYNGEVMANTKHVRRSVSLPVALAKQVDRLAQSRRLSDNRVLVELIELGIEARKSKEKEFFELAERFRAASDPREVKRLGDELGRLMFGE
jgi:hypothetical protein